MKGTKLSLLLPISVQQRSKNPDSQSGFFLFRKLSHKLFKFKVKIKPPSSHVLSYPLCKIDEYHHLKYSVQGVLF